ncbi:MAG: aldo/keto reductase [Lachnospiraceae bacterium]|nr:aldo/keto reductase [Lachnospiraceae bacterium]
MKYRELKYVPLHVSEIVFGCAGEKMLRGENVDDLLDKAIDLGITTFDTAENYGKSEIVLGDWIRRRKNRKDIVIISKGCHPYDGINRVNPECLKQDLDQSFERLGTDFIDIYFLHRDDPEEPVGEIMEVLNDYHRAGKIGAFGGSNWTVKRIIEANEYAKYHDLIPMTVSSPNYSLCRQIKDPWGGGPGGVTITGPENKEARNWYEKEGIPVFSHSCLGRGMLSGKVKSDDPEGAKKLLDEFAIKGFYATENFERLRRAEELAEKKGATVSKIAIAWCLNQSLNVFPIMSCSTAERIKENCDASDVVLTEEEMKWLNLEK